MADWAVSLVGAIIVAVVAASAPVIVAVMTARSQRRRMKMDWARQDEVAARAEAAVRAASRQGQATNEKLDVIHTLVNSNMTAALQGELNATMRELAVMQEVLDLKAQNGLTPSKDSLAAMKAAEESISELTTQLEDRLSQQKLVEAQQAILEAQDAKADTNQ